MAEDPRVERAVSGTVPPAATAKWACKEDRMGAVTGGQLVARMLKREGVQHVFTLAGLHVAPIYAGLQDEGIRIVDTRHEQGAAHAADAYARITRGLGVAVVTAGPGVT